LKETIPEAINVDLVLFEIWRTAIEGSQRTACDQVKPKSVSF